MRIACAMLIGTCVAGWDCNPVWAATGAVNGTSVTISGPDASAFGNQTTASGGNATAFGEKTTADGNRSTAFGNQTTASGDSATAFGILSQALAANSLAALGGTTATEATNAAAIGQGATASLADSVALGSGSVANRAAGVKGTYFAAPNPEDSESAAWKSTQAAIAVGSDEGETRQIIGVAAGSKPTDAVNVAQLQNAFDALGGLDLTIFKDRLNNLDSKVNKAGAGAAALAALHPLDMDNKFDVSAAFGSYHDANALALGVFYRPTDNVMFSAGGSIGNGENMVNVGVTFALDKGQGVRVSKAAMAKKINALTDENAAMKQEIGALKTALARLEAKMK